MYSHNQEIERIVEELLKLLGDEYRYNCIEKPIEKVLFDFEPPQEKRITYRSFVTTVGRFVQNVFKSGLRVKQNITKERATSIAYMILESRYVGKNSRGFYAAYLDIMDNEIEGFELILSQMAEMLVALEHAKHTKWVLENRLGRMGWEEKCHIVEVIHNRMGPHLSEQLIRCKSAMFVDHIENLLNMMVASEKTVDKLLAEGRG